MTTTAVSRLRLGDKLVIKRVRDHLGNVRVTLGTVIEVTDTHRVVVNCEGKRLVLRFPHNLCEVY